MLLLLFIWINFFTFKFLIYLEFEWHQEMDVVLSFSISLFQYCFFSSVQSLSCAWLFATPVSDEPDHLAEEISKQSVEGAAWFLLLLMVKCKRKEIAVMRLEAEDCQQPQKPGRGQERSKSLQRAWFCHHLEFELQLWGNKCLPFKLHSLQWSVGAALGI